MSNRLWLWSGLLVSGLLLTGSPLRAESTGQFSLGAKLLSSTWKGENSGGADFESQSGQLSLEAKYQRERWFGGLTLQGGQFEFDDVAPDRPDGYTPPADETVKIKRGEVDLVGGYYFWPRVALFLDIKNVANEWLVDDYKVEYNGLGLGVSGYHPMSETWSFFGSFGVVPMNIKADGEKIGSATRSALNVGFLYRFAPRANFTVGLQSQTQTNDYDDGTEQTQHVGAVVFGVTGSL